MAPHDDSQKYPVYPEGGPNDPSKQRHGSIPQHPEQAYDAQKGWNTQSYGQPNSPVGLPVYQQQNSSQQQFQNNSQYNLHPNNQWPQAQQQYSNPSQSAYSPQPYPSHQSQEGYYGNTNQNMSYQQHNQPNYQQQQQQPNMFAGEAEMIRPGHKGTEGLRGGCCAGILAGLAACCCLDCLF